MSCQAMGVSERRACRVVGQNRSTQRHRTLAPQDEPSLVTRTLQLAGEYGRYGYRRITALLRREGWRVNHKRVERNLAAGGTESAEETAPQRPAVVERWVMPSVKTVLAGSCLGVRFLWQIETHDGRPLKILTVVDEYTRECLAIDVERRADSMSGLGTASSLVLWSGEFPDCLRSDNGSEFTARLVRGLAGNGSG